MAGISPEFLVLPPKESEVSTPEDQSVTEDTLKLNEISILKYKIDFITHLPINEIGYSEECVDIIYNYLLMFMRGVLEAMGEHKRRYRLVDCPLLLEMEEEKKQPEMVKLWEMDILWHKMTKEQMEMAKKYDEIEKEDELKKKRRRKMEMNTKTKGGKQVRFIDTHTETDQKKDDKTQNKEKEKDILSCFVTEQVQLETVYCHFTMKDLLELLEINPFVIPKKSIREILRTDAFKRVKSKHVIL